MALLFLLSALTFTHVTLVVLIITAGRSLPEIIEGAMSAAVARQEDRIEKRLARAIAPDAEEPETLQGLAGDTPMVAGQTYRVTEHYRS